MVARRILQLLFAIFWPPASYVRSFFSRLLNFGASVDEQTHSSKDANPRSPSRSATADPQQSPPAPQQPRRTRYIGVAGDWERPLYPHWPESAFKVPDVVPEGHVYYIRKGYYVRWGSTALVERLPSGHIAKTPISIPHDPEEDQVNRQSMEHEYRAYCFINGRSLFVPRLIDWDGQSQTLVLEDCPNGDLETYLRKKKHDADTDTRRKWALQAARAIESLHVIGMVHQDISPRNFLLDDNFDLRICDLAGSSFPGCPASVGCPGPRYQSRVWVRGYVPTQIDDMFSFGSVLYFIMTSEEPYQYLDEDEVEGLFEKLDFPQSEHLDCGSVIQDCWHGRFAAADQIVEALASVM